MESRDIDSCTGEQRRESSYETGFVLIGHVKHRRTEFCVDADTLDVDDARPPVGIDSARDPARLPVGNHRDSDEAFIVTFDVAARLFDDYSTILGDNWRRHDIDILQHGTKQAGDRSG